jgi:hypothetical protein
MEFQCIFMVVLVPSHFERLQERPHHGRPFTGEQRRVALVLLSHVCHLALCSSRWESRRPPLHLSRLSSLSPPFVLHRWPGRAPPPSPVLPPPVELALALHLPKPSSPSLSLFLAAPSPSHRPGPWMPLLPRPGCCCLQPVGPELGVAMAGHG